MSNLKVFGLLSIFVMIAYGGSLAYGFSQDDWYFLLISQKDHFSNIIEFFLPWMQSGFPFYRPLGTQVYFYLSTQLGGITFAPILMHTSMLIIQALNAYLVYKLLKHLHKNEQVSILVAVLYAVSAAHFLSLYYIAATQQLLAATFSLLSLNAFMSRYFWKAGLFFFLSLLSKENAIITPIIALILSLPYRNIKAIVKCFTPYVIVGLLYLALRLSVPLSIQSEYHFVLGPSVITNLRWYWIFAFGAPEELVRYGLPKMVIDYSRFLKDFDNRGIWLTIFPIILSILALYNLVKTKKITYLFWYIVGILPIIFLQDHLYPHYLDLSLIPLLLLLIEPLSIKFRYITAFILILTSLISINFSEQFHWTTKRARHSKLVSETVVQSCNNQGGVIFTGTQFEMNELSYALSLSNGPRVICDNPDLEVYYLVSP